MSLRPLPNQRGGRLARPDNAGCADMLCPFQLAIGFRIIFFIVLALLFSLSGHGCATTPPLRTTRLTDADLTQAVLAIRDQLAGSDFLAGRTADSPQARLVLRRVENLSTDRISVAEQWSLAARILSEPEMQALLRSKNITLQLPPEKIRLLETQRQPLSKSQGRGLSRPQSGPGFPALKPEHRPTHLLRAQIASATRAGSFPPGRGLLGPLQNRTLSNPKTNIRKEYYFITFVIENLQTRELLWQGTAELAREAEGTIID